MTVGSDLERSFLELFDLVVELVEQRQVALALCFGDSAEHLIGAAPAEGSRPERVLDDEVEGRGTAAGEG